MDAVLVGQLFANRHHRQRQPVGSDLDGTRQFANLPFPIDDFQPIATVTGIFALAHLIQKDIVAIDGR